MEPIDVMNRFYLFLTIVLTGGALAQSQGGGVRGFTAGNLVVTRAAYSGGASSVAIGQALPPVCPATAACGMGRATDNGAFPTTGSTNNVWNNNLQDGSFGI